MRRKLFCAVLGLVIALYFADYFGMELQNDPFSALKNETHTYTAKIVRVKSAQDYYSLEADIETADGRTLKTRKKVLLNYYDKPEKPWELYNAVIIFEAVLEEPQQQRNPHCFDYRKYLKSRGIYAVASLESFDTEDKELSAVDRYERWLFRKRCEFEEGLSQKTKGLITGVVFGDTTYMDEEEYETFRNNGTAHILAVSGLHIGILYGLYKKLAGRQNRPVFIIIFGILLFSYGMLSMWSPSTVRASIMVVLSLVARITDLRYDMLTAMSTAALILIVFNPYVVFGTGFQMSFLAICSISFIRPVIPAKIPEFIVISTAVTLGLLPYQIYQFNYISFVAVFVNVPIVFLTGYFVPVALLYFAESIISGGNSLIRPVAEGLAHLIAKINEVSSTGGYGWMEVVSPPFWAAALAGALIFFFCSEYFALIVLRKQYRFLRYTLAGITACALIAGSFVYTPQSRDEIVFVDVGQGDCIHLRAGKKDVLIDGGGNINYNIGKKTLKPYLLKNGAPDVDAAFVTHLHTDHYKGIEELSDVFRIRRLYSEMTSGQTVKIDDNIYIETLWPEYIPEEGQEENSFCSVFMIYYGSCRILVTGDIDEAGERALTEKYKGTDKLKCNILKIAHHGSAYSSCEAFLDAADPEFAVIQCGKNNYGHPAPKTIENCHKKGIIVYRNDLDGAVSFSIKKDRIKPHVLIE